MSKNPAGKMRKFDAPYAQWIDPVTGWKYWLLKSYQADNSKPLARWMVRVEGFGIDMGDEYVSHMERSIMRSIISGTLVWDKTIWATAQDFNQWVGGTSE